MSKTIKVDLYGDFTCPWVYRILTTLKGLKEARGNLVEHTFRYFALDQVNQKNGSEWHLWENADTYPSRGVPAFRAAEAARRQGPEAFNRMAWALLEGRHVHRKDFREPVDMEEIVRTSGIDVAQYKKDLQDPMLLNRLAEDHTRGAKLGVFGTPTLVFENGSAFFLRARVPDNAEDAAKLFESIHSLFVERDFVDEVKRPKPPVPA